jgi:hypothetical protein
MKLVIASALAVLALAACNPPTVVPGSVDVKMPKVIVNETPQQTEARLFEEKCKATPALPECKADAEMRKQ